MRSNCIEADGSVVNGAKLRLTLLVPVSSFTPQRIRSFYWLIACRRLVSSLLPVVVNLVDLRLG
jgi:hypothetical protein